MKPLINLNRTQAAYIVAALHHTITTKDDLLENDRMHMEAILNEMAAPLDLDDTVRKRLDDTQFNSSKDA